jgi:hypothetical protein
MSCEDDTDLPSGLYHYQIERLLSGGEEKIWVLNSQSINGSSSDIGECPPELLISTYLDSVVIRQLLPKCDTIGYDTLQIGTANASTDDLLFTDSLVFSDDSFWILKNVYAQSFTAKYMSFGEEFVENYRSASDQ